MASEGAKETVQSASEAAISAAKQRQLGLSTNQLAVSASWAAVPRSKALTLLKLPASKAQADDSETYTGAAGILTQITTLEISVPATCVCFNREGTHMVTGGDDKTVRLWETLPPAEAPARTWTHGKKIGCVTFSPDGATILFADLFGEVYSVSLAAGASAEPELLLGHLSPISHLAFHPTETTLLSADREGHVRESAWPHSFVIDCYYLEHTSPLVLMLAIASAPLVLTSATDGQTLCAWKAHTGELVRKHTAAELLGGTSNSEQSSSTSAAIACGCEVKAQGLVALAPKQGGSIHFCAASADASAIEARPALACELPSGAPGAAALSYSADSAVLCVLLVGGEGVALLPAAASGQGFGASTLLRFCHVPDAALLAGAAAEVPEDHPNNKKARLESK